MNEPMSNPQDEPDAIHNNTHETQETPDTQNAPDTPSIPSMASMPDGHHAPLADGRRGTDELRAALVATLKREGTLTDLAVERALARVPRHLFLPSFTPEQAYADTAVATHWDDGQPVSSASQPSIVAMMLQQLDVQPGMRVLEIGAGTGYNAALLAELTGPDGSVTTVDIDEEIAAEARAHLDAAGYPSVRVVAGDGARGWPDGAPYDRIELTVGAFVVTPAWFEQLAEGGVLVLPFWLGTSDVSIAFRKRDGALASESLTPCGFMRLRGAEAGGAEWATLPDGRMLGGENVAPIVDAVAALLRERPRRRIWSHPDADFLRRLGLTGLRVVALSPASDPRVQRWRATRYGLYGEGEDGPSLSLFAARMPLLMSFGGRATERTLEAEQAAWLKQQVLPLVRWRVVAHPRASAPATPPPGALRLERGQFTYDVETAPPA